MQLLTVVTSDIEAGETAVDPANAVADGLVAELVARSQTGGVKLAGEGGLLAEPTRRALESTLEGRMAEPAAGPRANPSVIASITWSMSL
ncbi:hypothetical protein [Streptomyces sp. NPDC048392]|uniref:hypothetical protein n=1 Tax=Streptomyces sp. NPDC048392 TaxID=3365543 RepID=UPI0037123DA2